MFFCVSSSVLCSSLLLPECFVRRFLLYFLGVLLCVVSGRVSLGSWRFSSTVCFWFTGFRCSSFSFKYAAISARCLSWIGCFCGCVICCARRCCKLKKINVFRRTCKHIFEKQSSRNGDLRLFLKSFWTERFAVELQFVPIEEKVEDYGLKYCAAKRFQKNAYMLKRPARGGKSEQLLWSLFRKLLLVITAQKFYYKHSWATDFKLGNLLKKAFCIRTLI